jgi:hypothetical protein
MDITAGAVTLAGVDGTRLVGGHLTIKGSRTILENITFKDCHIRFSRSSRSSMRGCRMFGGALALINSNDFVLFDVLAPTVLIDKSERVEVTHCTFVSNDETVASLRVDARELRVKDSVIYGRGFAVTLLRDQTKRKCVFEKTLIFGEKGFCARDRKNDSFRKRDIATTKSRIRRFLKIKDDIYDPPQFVNHLEGDWRLVPGAPGTKAASDGKDCGVLFQ